MYMPQLTEIVRTVRKDHPGAFRYKWEFSDGPARFEAVFIDRVSHVDPDDGRPCAVMTVIQILSDESEGRIWSHQYQVKRARNGMLYSNPYLDADYASLKAILQIRSSGGRAPMESGGVPATGGHVLQTGGRTMGKVRDMVRLAAAAKHEERRRGERQAGVRRFETQPGRTASDDRQLSQDHAAHIKGDSRLLQTDQPVHTMDGTCAIRETENRLPRNIIEVQRYSHLD